MTSFASASACSHQTPSPALQPLGEAPRHFLVFTGTVPKLTAVAPDVDQSPTRARNLGLGLRSERNPLIRRDRRLFEGATGRREQVQEHRND